MTGLTDEEAVSSLRTGNNGAFRVLYERYAPRGLSYASAILHNESDAEEALQEAFCRLLAPIRRGAVDPARGGFRAFFFGTLRNLSIDMLRRRRLSGRVSLESVPEPHSRPVAGTAEGPGGVPLEAAERVRGAFTALPPNHAEALRLRVNGGLSYEQIAGVLGCSRPQVRTWIYRARRRLEEIFTRDGLMPPRSAAAVNNNESGEMREVES
jgi:RNA polymerase sigma-70 factor (ECF subfamily)